MKKGYKKNISQRTFQGEVFDRIDECIPTKEDALNQAKRYRENPIESTKRLVRVVKASCGYDIYTAKTDKKKKGR
jgi:hypothetical protein